ncbi:MAG: hypothetical protein ACK4Z9_05820, partial [Thermodesulfovibrionales bacterium]
GVPLLLAFCLGWVRGSNKWVMDKWALGDSAIVQPSTRNILSISTYEVAMTLTKWMFERLQPIA